MIGRLGPLSERPFRFLYFARAVSLFGDGLVPVALPFAVLSIDRSAAALGFVLASRSLSLVVFVLLGGVIADRLARKAVLIAADLVRLVAQAVMAALLVAGVARLWMLIVLVGLYGMGDAFFRPTSTGFIPETVSMGRLQQANALIVLTTSSFAILGPAVGGVLVATVGPGWALAVDAGTFLVSALLLVPIQSLAKPLHAARQSLVRELADGWRVFRSRTWLWVDGVFSALGSFATLAPMFALGPLIAARSLGGAPAWATIVAAFGIGSVLAAVVLFRFRPRRPLLVGIPPLAFLGLPALLLALVAPTPVIALGALLGGFGLTFFNTLFETTVQRQIPAESLSRVASIDWVMSGGLQPLGFALAGSVAAAAGAERTLVGAALWIVASTAAVLSVPSIRAVRDSPQPNPPPRAGEGSSRPEPDGSVY